MGWVLPAIMLGSAAAGALSNRPSKQQTSGQQTTGGTQSSNSSSQVNQQQNTVQRGTQSSSGTNSSVGTQIQVGSGTNTSSILPQFATEAQPLLNELLQKYLASIQGGTPTATQIGNEGVRAANAGAGMRKKAIDNILASRGLLSSPVAAAAQIASESGRVSDVVRARTESPFQAQQLLAQNLGQASNFLQMFRGQQQSGATTSNQETTSVQNALNQIFQTSTNEQELLTRIEELANSYGINSQTTNQTGTVTQPGNVLGGAATGATSALGLLMALGQIGKANAAPATTTNPFNYVLGMG